MVSTNFNAPPLKLMLLAIGAVVILHVLTAMVLVMVHNPAPTINPIEATAPIEIQLITPAAETEKPEIKIEKIASAPVEKPQPPVKAKPVTKAPAKPIKKEAPKTKEVPKTKPSPQPTKVIEKQPVVTPPVSKQPEPIIAADTAAADEQRRISMAQAKQAETEAQLKAQAEANAKAVQQAQADREAQAIAKAEAEQAAQANAQKAAQEQAAREAQAAKEAAQRAAQQVAASNAPANFTANNASWASQPRFEFPSRAKRGARAGDTFNVVLSLRVNKQGGIESVNVAQSSGNPTIDKEAQRQVRSGKFKPFTKDGVPRVGNVTFTVSYQVPD